MTALLREPLMVLMPAAAVAHVRLVSRWERVAPGVLDWVPPLCRTRLPAFVCACGERRLILEWPDGQREWQTEDGRYVMETPRYRVEYSDQGRRRRLLFLSGDAPTQMVSFGTPPEPDHWTERALPTNPIFSGRLGTWTGVRAPQESPEERASMAALTAFWYREVERLMGFEQSGGPVEGACGPTPPESPQVAPLPNGQIGVTDEHGLRAMVEADTVDALLDYARKGNEGDFRDLATMSGVPLAQLDELWQGTCARLGGVP